MASASRSAPSLPWRESRSESRVKPEMSTNTSVPSNTRTAASGVSSRCRSTSRGTYGRRSGVSGTNDPVASAAGACSAARRRAVARLRGGPPLGDELPEPGDRRGIQALDVPRSELDHPHRRARHDRRVAQPRLEHAGLAEHVAGAERGEPAAVVEDLRGALLDRDQLRGVVALAQQRRPLLGAVLGCERGDATQLRIGHVREHCDPSQATYIHLALLGGLDDEHRTARLVGDRVRDASEHAPLHALVADDQDVGVTLVGEADEDVAGIALVGHRAALDALARKARLRARDELPDPGGGVRRPLHLHVAVVRLRRGVVQRAQEDDLGVEPARDLHRHVDRRCRGRGTVDADGDPLDHQLMLAWRSAIAWATVAWTAGIERSSVRKLLRVITTTVIGDVAVTVAVRRSSSRSAISPKKSPAPSCPIRFPPRSTSAVPVSITKNSWPKSPSRASTLPAGTSSSSVCCASTARSFFDMSWKKGTSLSRACCTGPPRQADRRSDRNGLTEPSPKA